MDRSEMAVHESKYPPDAALDGRQCRVFILCDVRLYREGIVACLSRRPNLFVVGSSDTSPTTLARLAHHSPDVIVLDLVTPASVNIARSLAEHLPSVRIVAFAVSEREDQVLACAEAGIAGYVTADASEDDLVAAIEYALRGEIRCSPRMAGVLFRRIRALSGRPPPVPLHRPLTLREQQILVLVERGKSNKEIAQTLRIGNATVKNHIHNILEKLEVHRRGEAVARFRGAAISPSN
jgi:two-component system, NarL family, nitrate/nitrite response regulator NarL